jgi:Tfp pilus assembly protein FimT
MAVSVIVVLAAASIPHMRVGLDRARAREAARYLAAQMSVARSQAVLKGTAVGVRTQADAQGVAISLVIDRNGNGIRTRDIEDGIDVAISRPVRIDEQFPGVVIGVPGSADFAEAVRAGATGLFSFTPSGTSTGGSIFVLGRDGSRFAIRVLGVTARVRIERYDERLGTWVRSL